MRDNTFKEIAGALRTCESPKEQHCSDCPIFWRGYNEPQCRHRMMLDAATAIDTLLEENTALRAKYTGLQLYNASCTKRCKELNMQNAELRQKIKKLIITVLSLKAEQ
jgi:hypothetical protein